MYSSSRATLQNGLAWDEPHVRSELPREIQPVARPNTSAGNVHKVGVRMLRSAWELCVTVTDVTALQPPTGLPADLRYVIALDRPREARCRKPPS